MESVADLLDDNIMSAFELQRDLGMTANQAARAKDHTAHAPLLVSAGAQLDGRDDGCGGGGGGADASLPMLELTFGHVSAGRLAVLAAAMAAHEPSARDHLLAALDAGLHVLR